jgi:hypothetical protein
MAEAALLAASTSADKEGAYKAVVESLASANDDAGLQAAVVHVLGVGVSATIKPKVLYQIAACLPAMDAARHEAMAEFFLSKINSSSTRASHEPQMCELYKNLAKLYEGAGNLEKAAKSKRASRATPGFRTRGARPDDYAGVGV